MAAIAQNSFGVTAGCSIVEAIAIVYTWPQLPILGQCAVKIDPQRNAEHEQDKEHKRR
jgi:hypothetical protein